MPLNINPYKELLILINGPIFQYIAYFILTLLLPKEIAMIKIYHYSILIFNLLPIYPLDGGRLLNLLIEYFIPYKNSIKLSIFISYIFLFILFIKLNNIKINIVIMFILLIFIITKEKYRINYTYNKFLLERYLNNYNFKNSTIISSINNLYRNKKHIIKDNNNYYLEKEYLKKIYKNR